MSDPSATLRLGDPMPGVELSATWHFGNPI